jgi:enoyl-CoA hydratase/carnithine racemase
LLIDVQDGIALLTLNRPERLNAIHGELRHALIETLNRLNRDDLVRALVLTGAGNRGFSAGQDLQEAAGMDWQTLVPWQRNIQAMYQAVRDLDKPCVVAINGVAAGAGFQVALCADWRIATPDSRIGQPEVKAGMASIVGSYLMTLFVGRTHNVQMSLSGELVSGQRAYEIGLVTELAPDGDALPIAMERARQLAAIPSVPMRLSKERFRSLTQAGFDDACMAGIRAQLECYAHGVPQAVMQSFLAKKRG